MQQLDASVPFDQVLPILARSFEAGDALEQTILGEAQFDGRTQAAGVKEDDEDDDFVDVSRFREELSGLSRATISFIDSALLKRVARGDPGLTCALAIRITRVGCSTQFKEDWKEMEEDALLLLGEAAQGGDSRAQWILGERYSRMKGGLEEGIRLLGQSAARGHERAGKRLKELFERRYVFIHDQSEKKWLVRFAEAGVPEAQFEIANELYLQGELASAFKWMHKAATAGHKTAQERLAFFYEIGEGCIRNREHATYWRELRAGIERVSVPDIGYEKGAEQDSPSAVVEQPQTDKVCAVLPSVEVLQSDAETSPTLVSSSSFPQDFRNLEVDPRARKSTGIMTLLRWIGKKLFRHQDAGKK